MGSEWCAVHNRYEPLTDTTYKVCGECWHAWQTPKDFYRDCKKQMDWLNEAREKWGGNDEWTFEQVRDSGICPLCTHDF